MLHPNEAGSQRSANIAGQGAPLDLTAVLRQLFDIAPGCGPSSTVGDRLRALGIDLAEAEQIAANLAIERLRSRA